MLKEEEADEYNENFMETEEKESKLAMRDKNIGGMESSIRFQQKGLKSNINANTTKISV
jgi:hypothetical protein